MSSSPLRGERPGIDYFRFLPKKAETTDIETSASLANTSFHHHWYYIVLHYNKSPLIPTVTSMRDISLPLTRIDSFAICTKPEQQGTSI
mgnify:CR=1 FL=1